MTAVTTLVTIAAVFTFGVVSWSLAEYLLHRFAMHQLRGRGVLSREHLRHHAGVLFELSKTLQSWAGVIGVGLVLAVVASWLVGPLVGLSWVAGWVLGYGIYDALHARAHVRAPRNRYERWLRTHHFHHHFGHPMENHGVTSPVWDVVFGTRSVPDRVRVPRRMAMKWLVDESGTVKPEYRDDYYLVGGAQRGDAEQARDTADAFANRPPAD